MNTNCEFNTQNVYIHKHTHILMNICTCIKSINELYRYTHHVHRRKKNKISI